MITWEFLLITYLFRDLEDAGSGIPGRENLGSDAWFFSAVIPGTQGFFAAIRPKSIIIYL